jgi:predicted CopG family antitoxin
MEMAVSELMRMQEPDFYSDVIFKLVPRWDKCINVLWDYFEK